ncbi:ferrous iron transport protein B [Thermodesulfobium narugense DSM 14796]|uniref:Ferrous iron transport protein B n=1 Tax=Thermodesulfobium narugense DSM 14796 TaxID=747365 RepID=M1E636_9BACT|nr:ferrous iron transport protein B [Thermodesulfobium narugense]AEE15402.1 ferrous iron transport protein B [Thermodesulfobium narugense DSM 14796]
MFRHRYRRRQIANLSEKIVKVAFVGNPNVGKSALINALSGSNLKVGNWPGVTVEKKEANIIINNQMFSLVDLPGAYSLNPFSLEEKITRDFLIKERPDVIVNVVDSNQLEKSLFLTFALSEFEIPMVIALNFFDEMIKNKTEIDIKKLRDILSIEVVPTSGIKGIGIDELKKAIYKSVSERDLPNILFEEKLDKRFKRIKEILSDKKEKLGYPLSFVAARILENDQQVISELNDKKLLDKGILELAVDNTTYIESRYKLISSICKKILVRHKDSNEITQKIDSILLNKFFGLPLFFIMMFIVFKLTFDLSKPFVDFTSYFINDYVGKYTIYLLWFLPDILKSLIKEAIIGGVGSVISFFPLIGVFFLFISILEESGYMTRAAFLIDKLMSSIGLSGKVFIPLILGFGCNVPAIYATRGLDSQKDRLLAGLMIPLMSCSARLPVYLLFTAAFFENFKELVILCLYFLGAFIAIILVILLQLAVPSLKMDSTPFILELPPYRIPPLKFLLKLTGFRVKSFVRKAGSVILFTMILVWSVNSLPYNAPSGESYLAQGSKAISFIFAPAGFDKWEAVATLLPSVVAKEAVIGTLGQILEGEQGNSNTAKDSEEYNFLSDTSKVAVRFKDSFIEAASNLLNFFTIQSFQEKEKDEGLINRLKTLFTPLSALSFMIFILLFVPCIVTISVLIQEYGIKWTIFEICMLLFISYSVSTLVYQAGKLFVH